jgi:hypothetical protein
MQEDQLRATAAHGIIDTVAMNIGLIPLGALSHSVNCVSQYTIQPERQKDYASATWEYVISESVPALRPISRHHWPVLLRAVAVKAIQNRSSLACRR